MRQLRVLSRWAMISFVGVAMAAFIVFDVLDLDGSNLRRSTNGSTLTADPPASETKRLVFRTADPSLAPGSEASVPRLCLPIHAGVTRPGTRPPVLRAHRTVAHLHAWRDALRGTSSIPDDPA